MQHRLIQIRHVPEPVHRKLKTRAAQAGMSLSDYLLREIEGISKRPTMDELFERIRLRDKVSTPLDTVSAVRDEREARR
jgi:plasmid stability protein